MSVLMLDASVWLAAVDDRDRFHRAAREVIFRTGTDVDLAALDLTLLEVANVAVTRWRSPAEAQRLVALVTTACGDRLVRCDGALARAATELAGRERLSVYDASYVAAAARQGWTLVSADLRDLVNHGHAVAPDGVV